jgi:hypothetical protein
MVEAKRLGAVEFLVKGTIGYEDLVARICELAGEPTTSRTPVRVAPFAERTTHGPSNYDPPM